MGNDPIDMEIPSGRNLGISIDIEDWYHIPPVSGTPSSKYKNVDDFRKNWSGRYDYITEPTKRTLDMLDRYDITATIFVVADVIDHYPELIDDIRSRGRHEIGCHGLTHATKIDPKTKAPLMSVEEFRSRTMEARDKLESTFNVHIHGYRAPNAYMAGWMMDSLEDLGFLYSSSVSANSIFNKTDSKLSDVTSRPYFPEPADLNDGKEPRGIVELPFSHYKKFGVRIPTSGGPLLRLLGPSMIMRGLSYSLKNGDTIFYFHPIDIARENFPCDSFINRMFWRTKGEKVQKNIEKIINTFKNDVNFVPLIDISKTIRGGAMNG